MMEAQLRPVILGLDQIQVDHDIQVRVEGTDQDTVEGYAAVLDNGGELDPVVVIRDQYGVLRLGDGFHRYEAYIQAAKTEIPAIVLDGDRNRALEEAEEANLKHGKKLTMKDKKNVLYRRLERKHEWSKLSARQLGRLLGVSHQTVGRWIEEYNDTGPSGPVDRSTVVTSDGREINTENIGTNQTEPEAKTTPATEWRTDPRPVDTIDQKTGEVTPLVGPGYTGSQLPTIEKPQGVSIKPIETGDDANIAAPKNDREAAIMRQYKIEGPAAELFAAVDKLLETRNLDILTLLDEKQRQSVLNQLFAAITHSLRLMGQMVSLDTRPEQLERVMDMVYEMSDMLDRVTEEVNKYIPTQPEEVEYVDNGDDEEIRELTGIIERSGFDVHECLPHGAGWRARVTIEDDGRIPYNTLRAKLPDLEHKLPIFELTFEDVGKRPSDDGLIEVGAWLLVQPKRT